MADSSYANRISVTTGLTSLFDQDGTLLKVNALDSALSLSLCEKTIDASNRVTYPKEKRHNCILSHDKVATLYQKIIDDVVPASKDGKTKSVGVFTSKDRNALLSVGVNNMGEFFLTLATNIVASDHSCSDNDVYGFKFQKTELVSDYNPKTGSYEIDRIDGQFALFIMILQGFLMVGCSGNAGHSNRVTNEYNMQRVYKYLEAFAAKLQVAGDLPQLIYKPTGGFNRSGNQVPWGSNNPGQPQTELDGTPLMAEVTGGAEAMLG